MTFFNVDFILCLVCSFIVSVGFGVLLKTNPRHLLYAGLCGFITYFVYYAVEFSGASLFVAAFASSIVTATYAETMARLRKAPNIIYLLTGIIPTVPGADLYYTMKHIMMGNGAEALASLFRAIGVGLGIAGGIVTLPVIWGLVSNLVRSINRYVKQRAISNETAVEAEGDKSKENSK